VKFTAPASGASGKFGNGTNTITLATNSSGVASAPFTSSTTVGGLYTVTAAAAALTTVNFLLTNRAVPATVRPTRAPRRKPPPSTPRSPMRWQSP